MSGFSDLLEGRKIEAVRPMTREESKAMGFRYYDSSALVLDLGEGMLVGTTTSENRGRLLLICPKVCDPIELVAPEAKL